MFVSVNHIVHEKLIPLIMCSYTSFFFYKDEPIISHYMYVVDLNNCILSLVAELLLQNRFCTNGHVASRPQPEFRYSFDITFDVF